MPSDVFACVGPLSWRETIQCRGPCPLLAEVYLALPSDGRGPCPFLSEVCLALPSDGRGPCPLLSEVHQRTCQALLCPLTFVFILISFQMFSKDHAEQITPLSGPTFTACTVIFILYSQILAKINIIFFKFLIFSVNSWSKKIFYFLPQNHDGIIS